MREIKFRGYQEAYGYFVYGFYFVDEFYQHWIIRDDGFKYFIERPETVGQYTGLKDKNGVEIYEKDIYKDEDVITEIVFLDYAWREKLISSPRNHLETYFPFSCNIAIAGEVIGNVFENPELLEVQT